MIRRFFPFNTLALCIFAVMSGSISAHGVVVRFSTDFGNFDVRLYQTATPISVSNFLGYVTRGDYVNGFIHRSYRDSSVWVIQGGGYRFDGGPNNLVTNIGIVPPQAKIPDEVKILNMRGTLAYAKTTNNSATSQWYINLTNAPLLDVTNNPNVGAYTVFGRVLGSGMTVLDAVASVPRFAATGVYGPDFGAMPLRNFQIASGFPSGSNLVSVTTTQLNYRDGDYNFDGQVNMADLCLAHNKLGSTTEAEADGNGDGVVNQADLDIWAANADAAASAVIKGISLRNLARSAQGTVQFTFTNAPGLCLSVESASSLSQLASLWTRLGDVSEISSGSYRFIDVTATNLAQRFYRVSP